MGLMEIPFLVESSLGPTVDGYFVEYWNWRNYTPVSRCIRCKVIDRSDELFAIPVDTTSLSVAREYPDQNEFRIDRGFSKNRRPDLKQIVFGLCTVRGLGICANVNPGNSIILGTSRTSRAFWRKSTNRCVRRACIPLMRRW